ncbi:MAG: clostripain-related cysteine peptidase [Candidatus Eremiobacterota bacterium]
MQITSAAPPKAPGLNVIAYIDASEKVVEPFLANRLEDFEQVRQDDPSITINATVVRSGVGPVAKGLAGLSKLAVTAAAPIAGYAVGGVTGLAVGSLLAAGLFAVGFTRQGLGEVVSAFYHRKMVPDGDWSGQRTFEIAPDDDAGLVSQHSEGSQDLGQFLGSKLDPQANNVVVLGGHGLGYRQVASMPTSQVRLAFEQAARLSGTIPQVVLMESCLMSNLEALEQLKGQAQVAVVSEETLGVTALPMKEMLVEAARHATPQEIGRSMVAAAAKTGEVETIAAIDLSKLDDLNRALDVAGQKLLGEIRAGKKEEVQTAARQAFPFPQGKMLFLERTLLGLSDLGNFLDNLQQANLGQDTRQAAADARQALAGLILAEHRSEDYQSASGISFERKNADFLAGPGMDSYHNVANLPQSWKDLVRELS